MTSRTTHEAEMGDILCVLELLDNANVLNPIQFVAVSIDRIPKYGRMKSMSGQLYIGQYVSTPN